MPIIYENEIFQKIAPLAQGGLGDVYIGQNQKGFQVAIKEVHRQEYRNSPTLIERAKREGIHLKYEHPNLVKMVGTTFDERGHHFIISQLYNGETLRQKMDRERVISHDFIDNTLIPSILNGLEFLHHNTEKGMVIHRDIKPSNIFIEESGNIRIIDFGIAHVAQLKTLTNPNNQPLTEHYCAPELICPSNPRLIGKMPDSNDVENLAIDINKPARASTDLYSLGVMLFELYTGKKPFEHPNRHHLHTMIIHNTIPHDNRIPNIRRTALFKLLQKKQRDRYQTVAEFRKDWYPIIPKRTFLDKVKEFLEID
jgi:eukaryotic-like serine/threonine-protein kinase